MSHDNRPAALQRYAPRYATDVRLYRDALRDAVELPIITRGVLYVLAQWMNRDGTNARPRLERLAASCQLRPRAVAKHLSLAVDTGYLVRTSEGHRGQTAVYRATIPEYRWDTENGRLTQPNPVVEPPQRLHECAGCDRKGCTGRSERLHADDKKACTSVQPDLVTRTSRLLRSRKKPRFAFSEGPTPLAAVVRRESFDQAQDDPMEWVSNQVDGFQGCEEPMAQKMIDDGWDVHVVVNKIHLDRAA